ncbi:tetratricopeptide repeat protein [Kitasatospora sp. NPDC094011]|uniref:tetratricopeptide repeat protein n=1 Tax=Kitasatospora sp. NPDC094011 TaxID=3364090 RepID=UPI0038052FDD
MQPRNSRLNSSALRGAVDLAAVKAAGEAAQKAEQARVERARQAAAAEADGVAPQPALQLVIDVTEDTFETEVVQRSTEVPVVIDFWAEWCGPCKQLSPILEGLAEEYAGAFVLAKIDVDANQLIAQQFGIQGIPAVMAVVAGQLVPLFQGAESAANVRKVLDQLILVAEQRFGISGTGAAVAAPGEPGEAVAAQRPEDPALSAAHDALDAGDLAGAIRAYQDVLADQPGNTEATLGLAQAELLQRVEGLDLQAVRSAAAADPKDVEAQLRAADLDLVGGHVEDAFGRLVSTVGRTFGEDRDTARLRLLELFEVIGPEDPRVVTARAALARVLF